MRVSEYIKLVNDGNQNTYKHALGYVLAQLNPQNNIIEFKEIADKVIDFYYTRAIIPGLSHTSNPKQQPKAITAIKEVLQEEGLLENVDVIPKEIKERMIEKIVNEKNKGFFKYVLPCWEGARKSPNGNYIYPPVGENSCFSYSLGTRQIILKDDFKNLINDNSELLKEMVLEALEHKLKRFNKVD